MENTKASDLIQDEIKQVNSYKEVDMSSCDIVEMLYKLKYGVEEIEEIDGWVSVEDRLPEEDGEYLIFEKVEKNDKYRIEGANRYTLCWFSKGCFYANTPTHWKKIQPPKGF